MKKSIQNNLARKCTQRDNLARNGRSRVTCIGKFDGALTLKNSANLKVADNPLWGWCGGEELPVGPERTGPEIVAGKLGAFRRRHLVR